jgi:hypothetical protein
VASQGPFGVAPWRGSLAYRLEQSKGGERRQSEGERKELGFKLNFLKISNQNLKTLIMKVVGNLKIYNFF